MSQTIRNGQSIRVNIQTGEKLSVVAVTGSYSITVLAGTGTGTSLATSATGGTYGPYAYPLVVQIVSSAESEIDYDAGVTTSIESDTVALLKTDPLTGEILLTRPDGATTLVLTQAQQDAMRVHQRYHCHISNGLAFADSLNIPDGSGAQNNGVANAALAVGTLHATAGYYSTGTLVNEMIDIPDFNFDWNSGESLFLFWLQKTATPASNKNVFGHVSTTATGPGLRLTATSAGDLSVALFNAAGTAATGISSVAGCFDGNLNGVGVFLNGSAKTFSGWKNSTLVRNSIAWTLAGSTATAVSPKIGGTAESTTPQAATKTRALVIVKFAAGDTLPSVATVTAAIGKLMVNPARLLSKEDLQ